MLLKLLVGPLGDLAFQTSSGSNERSEARSARTNGEGRRVERQEDAHPVGDGDVKIAGATKVEFLPTGVHERTTIRAVG